MLFCKTNKSLLLLPTHFEKSTHSSMDRISDSGSDDWGSTPHGCTKKKTLTTCDKVVSVSRLDFNTQQYFNTHFYPFQSFLWKNRTLISPFRSVSIGIKFPILQKTNSMDKNNTTHLIEIDFDNIDNLPLFEPGNNLQIKEDIVYIDNLNNKSQQIFPNVIKVKKMICLLICETGMCQFTANEQFFNLKSGDVFHCLPNCVFDNFHMSEDFSGKILGLSESLTKELLIANLGILDIALAIKSHPVISLSPNEKRIIDSYCQLLTMLLSRDNSQRVEYEETILHAFLQSVIYEFFSLTRDRIKQDTQSQFQGLRQSEITLKKFMSLLINDGGRNRSVTYYAEQLFISPKYLSSLMKKTTGRTALDIIREITVKNIKQDLLYSEKSIKEIANEYDFPNISFFGKFFKQQMGISPRQYRNQNKKQISTDTNPKLDL